MLAAVTEFDAVGRDRFLEDAGFGRAKNYFLDVAGSLYDSWAIVGHAHGISGDQPLRARDFSGGEKTVGDRLKALGFTVRYLRNPAWTWDEIVLACALVKVNDWRTIAEQDSRAIALSKVLQSTAIHPLEGRMSDFRNPAGIERKTGDLVSRLPGRKPTNGNRLDAEVLQAFQERPDEMDHSVQLIRAAFDAWGNDPNALPDADSPDHGPEEGGVLLRSHLRRERSSRLRHQKITEAKRRGQKVACEACGFDFFETYGSRGMDYIECHHRTPLHVTGSVRSQLKDLALICSNCHRMIHRTMPWLAVEAVRDLVVAQRVGRPDACSGRT